MHRTEGPLLLFRHHCCLHRNPERGGADFVHPGLYTLSHDGSEEHFICPPTIINNPTHSQWLPLAEPNV